ncbi:MAG: hypothetical protein BWY27_00457 [Bacteroidetes bacterium ADurb.Bin234]|nr:MAG: hypothetical protein BWY27_00457 [Bacteroidetes bacterium ADurb.Bin234]
MYKEKIDISIASGSMSIPNTLDLISCHKRLSEIFLFFVKDNSFSIIFRIVSTKKIPEPHAGSNTLQSVFFLVLSSRNGVTVCDKT